MKLKINRLFLHRFIWAPTILKLKIDHFFLKIGIEEQQKLVYRMIETHGHKIANRYVKRLEQMLEKMSDLDKKIEELWSGQGLKKD